MPTFYYENIALFFYDLKYTYNKRGDKNETNYDY